MNKKNAHLFLPLLQALIDGKNIECLKIGTWVDLGDNVTFGGIPSEYRIKPEPETLYVVYCNGRVHRHLVKDENPVDALEILQRTYRNDIWVIKTFTEVVG